MLQWLTLLAIFTGPIFAVAATRFVDVERDRRRLKIDVFRSLMKTRRSRLSISHVEALNLVEVEFHKDNVILSAYKNYIQHLEQSPPQTGKDQAFLAKRSELFADLVSKIGRHLGYKYDKMDLERLSYYPEGLVQDEALTKQNAVLFNELLRGYRFIPIKRFHLWEDTPFPPAPKSVKE